MNAAFGHLTVAAQAWDHLMANTASSTTSARAGLFLNVREHYLLHLVAHTWLIWHTVSSKRDLKQQRARQQNTRNQAGRPRGTSLFAIRNTFYTIVELGSLVAWGSAAWHLMSS
jgi:hypothetical protein